MSKKYRALYSRTTLGLHPPLLEIPSTYCYTTVRENAKKSKINLKYVEKSTYNMAFIYSCLVFYLQLSKYLSQKSNIKCNIKCNSYWQLQISVIRQISSDIFLHMYLFYVNSLIYLGKSTLNQRNFWNLGVRKIQQLASGDMK